MLVVLGSQVIRSLSVIGSFVELTTSTLIKLITVPWRWRDVFQQIHFVANQSVGIIVFSVSFAAVVTILESSFHMKLVIQNDSLVPGFAALLILRELGAVVSALLLTSRVGAGLAAEVGTMKITEQIDALRLLGIDPVSFLVVPRFIACVIGGFLLSLIANVVCIYCAMLVSQWEMGYSPNAFLTSMKRFVEFQDLIFASIKGAVFGSVIPLVSCFYGFRCRLGAGGVGSATTQSVVSSSVLIIVFDFLLSWAFSHFY